MILFRYIIFSAFIFLNLIPLHSFSDTDTIYKKKHYNHIEYYSDKTLKSLGNMNGAEKTGDWIYFKPDGKIMAKGSYQNGKKAGKWVYIDYKNKKHTHKWDLDGQPEESFTYENNRPVMLDRVNSKDQAGNIRLNYKFGVLQYYVLD